MTNRLELNWKVDGFVDEQRYYCSETPIDIENLPEPKAIFAGDARGYIDTDIVIGQSYYIRIGSVKNGTEKISNEVQVSTGDIYFNSVDLLLIADQENGTSLVHDYSSNNRSVTTIGIRQARPRFNESCCYFSQGDSFSATINTLGTSDFTIESWIAPNDDLSADWCRLFQIGVEGAGYISLFRNASTSPMTYTLHARDASNTSLSLLTTAPLNAKPYDYNHICVMRKAGIFYLFIDGVLAGSNANYVSLSINLNTLYVLRSSSGNYMSAILDSFAVSKVARYEVIGFTPQELSVSDTKFSDFDLLIIFNNLNIGQTSFLDSSSNARALSKLGSPLVLKEYISDGFFVQDKANSSCNISATVGSLGTSDFTIEMFCTLITLISNTDGRVFQIGDDSLAGNIRLYLETGTNRPILSLYTNSVVYPLAGLPIIDNNFHHICVMRKAGVFYLFINGVLISSTADYVSYSITHTGLYIMNRPSLSRKAPMLLDSFRLTKVARYDVAGFVPIQFKKS
jgi:hypothetical protein